MRCWVSGWVVFVVSCSAFIFRVKHSKKTEHFFSSETAFVGGVFILRKSVRLAWLMSGGYGWRSEILTSTCQLVEICNFVPGPRWLPGDMVLDPIWCRLVYPECISQNVLQLSFGVPSVCSSDHKFHVVVRSDWLFCMMPVLYFICATVNNLDCLWLYGITYL